MIHAIWSGVNIDCKIYIPRAAKLNGRTKKKDSLSHSTQLCYMLPSSNSFIIDHIRICEYGKV